MAFEDWVGKDWRIVSHTGSPKFFETGRSLRFKEDGANKVVESNKAEGSSTKECGYDLENDEMTVTFDDPAQRCRIARYVRSAPPRDEVLICRVVDEPGGTGEAGSFTALDGSGDGGDDGSYA